MSHLCLYELGMFLLFIRGFEDLPLDASDSLWESLVISQFEKDPAFLPAPHYDDSPRIEHRASIFILMDSHSTLLESVNLLNIF
ncbi:MAG: hypothetical protein OXF06_09170 [Bacteroidetes bacterium]|nr:hypothetical protein [Bacteroidota bacterium]